MEDEQYTTENSGEKQHELLLFERQTLFVIIGISVLTLLVYFFGTDAKDLFTNIVTPLPQHQAFDGTVYPIKKVPDWVHLTEEERIASYDLIPEEKYIGVPRYSPARLATSIESLEWNNPEHDEIRNEKITYSVPYMGSYKLDGKEYAGSHAAVDIKVPQGTPIYAIANGVVTKVSESLYGFGHHIVIQHNDVPDPDSTEGASTTLHSSYSHLSKVLVAERDVVTKGQLIGLSGSTGTATTPHMHFQIDRDQAGWHPYWPFTSKEAAEAGLSFFQAINNGLGKENGLAYTVHPLVYVQKYLKETKRLAVAGPVETAVTPETSSAKISPRLTFLIEPIVQELFVGETITLKISSVDENGNLIREPEFEDRISLELLNNRGTLNRKFLTDGFLITGETTAVEIQNPTAGQETVILRFNGEAFSSKPLVIQERAPIITESESVTAPLTPPPVTVIEDAVSLVASSSPVNRGERIILEMEDTEVEKDTPIKIKLYYYNAQDDLTDPVLDAIFFLETVRGEGAFSPKSVKGHSFRNGIASFDFTPKEVNEPFAIKVTYRGMKVVSPALSMKTQTNLLNAAADDSATSVKSDTVSAQNPEEPPVFVDVLPSSEYHTALVLLKNEGIITGYPDGSFRPDQEVLRVEALKMIFSALKEDVAYSDDILFPDVTAGEWYIPSLNKSVADKIVAGYPDGTVRPNAKVTSAEFFKMLLRAAKTDIDPEITIELPAGIADTDWFAPYIQEAIKRNIIVIENNVFEGGKPMTRADIALVLYKLHIMQERNAERYEE